MATGPPEEVKIISRNGGVRGVYVRMHDELPAGIEDPAYQERPSPDPDKYFLFRSKGRWHLSKELAANKRVLCSTELDPHNEPDPTKIPIQPADSLWNKNVTKIQPCGDSAICRLEIHSDYENLRGGVRRQGDELLWVGEAEDSTKLYLWKLQDTWRLTQGPPGTPGGGIFFAKAKAKDEESRDPRKAAWNEADGVKSISKVWWDENANYDEGLWKDPSFPPNAKSLGAAAEEVGEVEWIPGRALDRDPSNDVLFDQIEASDLLQGGLGDCWLMAAVAAVAEFPSVIEALFLEGRSQLPPDGRHEIRLYDVLKDDWVIIAVDEFIPCKPRRWYELDAVPHFSRPVGHELWVLLLEKAFAKMFGGYGKLEGGTPVLAWQALTGVRNQQVFTRMGPTGPWQRHAVHVDKQKGHPCAVRLMHRKDDPSYTSDEIWYKLLQWRRGTHVLAASIDNHGSEEVEMASGLVTGHAYSVTQVRECHDFQLIQLRNPHGGTEWTGAWGDDDELWQKHPEVAQEIDHSVADDGTFWMCFEDFAKEFDTITLCPISVNSMPAPESSFGPGTFQAMSVEAAMQAEGDAGRCTDRCTRQCNVM